MTKESVLLSSSGKLGTLKELLPEHGPTRDDVMAWAREEARLETLKYKQEQEEKQIKLTFRADRQLDYGKQVFYRAATFSSSRSIIRCRCRRSVGN